jgi:hypothetical protein
LSKHATKRAVRSANQLFEFTRTTLDHFDTLLNAYEQAVARVELLIPFTDATAAIVQQTAADVASCRADVPRLREWIGAQRAELVTHEHELKFLKLMAT